MKRGRDIFPSHTTEAVELENGGMLVIRNIPCPKYRECDEILYTGDVARQMERLTATVNQLARELMAVDYLKEA